MFGSVGSSKIQTNPRITNALMKSLSVGAIIFLERPYELYWSQQVNKGLCIPSSPAKGRGTISNTQGELGEEDYHDKAG
jgi:hypothetical protein